MTGKKHLKFEKVWNTIRPLFKTSEATREHLFYGVVLQHSCWVPPKAWLTILKTLLDQKPFWSIKLQFLITRAFARPINSAKAKRNFATHSDLSAEITDPQKTFECSEMWLTLLQIPQQLSIKNLFAKVKLNKYLTQGLLPGNLI